MKNWLDEYAVWQTGSSLIEIIVATGVLALVLTALVAGMTVSLRTSAEAKYRSQAIKRGQEAMEVFRRERTLLGWDVFSGQFSSGSTYCLQELPAPKTSFAVGQCTSAQSLAVSGIDLYRQAVVAVDNTNPTDPQVKVVVSVTWDSGQGERGVDLTQVFRQWN
jgi:type II secretory pathway pseudopilin PulG